jgi:hypothetical protein
MSGSAQWSLSLSFSHQNPIHVILLPHTPYMPHPSHSSRVYHPHKIGQWVQIIKLLNMKFSSLPCYLVSLWPKYYPQHPILKHPQLTFLPHWQWQIFTPTQNNRQHYSSLYLNL